MSAKGEPSALHLGPRAFSTGVVDSLGEGFVCRHFYSVVYSSKNEGQRSVGSIKMAKGRAWGFFWVGLLLDPLFVLWARSRRSLCSAL